MTTVTITDRIMMIKGVKNRTVHFDFRWQRILRCGPRVRACTTQEASIESVSLRRIVEVARGPPTARGPIGSNRSNRLKAGPGY